MMWRLAAAAALLSHAAAAELRAMSMFRDGMVYAAPPPWLRPRDPSLTAAPSC